MFGLPYPRSEEDLKALVADKRYWNDRHPEHQAYKTYVTDLFRSFYSNESGSGLSRTQGIGSFPASKTPINTRNLLDNVNRYNARSNYSSDGADTTYKCRATGTCDIMP